MTDRDETVREMLREGRHREAAEVLLELGELRRAMDAFAAVWDYGRAAEVAISAGDLPRAMDYLIRAGDRDRAAVVRERLASAPEQAAEQAVALLVERGEQGEAALLLEARGELARAAELLRRTGELRRAAGLLDRAGNHRDAGRLYERLLAERPDDPHAALALARILGRFGRHEPAARAFQVAAGDPELRRPALRGLVVALHAMGLSDAARAALDDLHSADAAAPRTVEALVELESSPEREAERSEWIGGRYEVVRLLGGGAAGRVYLARDALYEREVALKVLAAASPTGGRDAFQRFVREAEVAAGLDHPNIVKLLDFDEGAGLMAMEFLPGGTLADRLAAGALPLELFREVLLAVLSALEAAHIRGVVHRDVKPHNVLFGRAGEIKLADFGVAHLQDLGLTQTGAFIGTLTYMAPEQITGDRVGAATDLYGLGVTLFHALCGRPPFVGADLVRAHLAEEPTAPSELRPALGPGFDSLFARLLQKVPSDRFQSAAEVRRAAEALDFREPEGSPRLVARAPEPVRVSEREEPLEEIAGPEPVAGGRARRALRRALEQQVTVLELEDPDRLEALRAMAPAFSPFLQTVLEVDLEARTVVLWAPEGPLLSAALAAGERLEPADALEATDQLARALEALHAVGRSHGEVGPDRVVLCRHRAVLLLPDRTAPVEAAERDAAGLEALVGQVLGGPPDLADLVATGALGEALGEGRARRLASELGRGGGLARLRERVAKVRAALSERASCREHLHALAAAARAAGLDPGAGEVAALLARRRAELDA